MKSVKYLSVVLTGAFMILACESENEPAPFNQEDTSASQDYTLADNLFGNVSEVTDQAEQNNDDFLEGGKTGASFLGNCVSITFDTVITSSTNKITVDFGSNGCTGKDGRTRKGKVFVEYDGRYRDSGTVIITTFEDYFVDNHQLLGSRTVTNLGQNTNGQTHFEIVVDGTVIKPNNGGEVIYKSNRVRTWREGENTQGLLGWTDDVYEITGSANGVSSSGRSFTVTITSPLEVKLLCKWVTQGTFELEPDGLPTRVFDFGDGDCDPNATLNVNGITINFVMP